MKNVSGVTEVRYWRLCCGKCGKNEVVEAWDAEDALDSSEAFFLTIYHGDSQPYVRCKECYEADPYKVDFGR